jgi:hypothetical protein
MRRCVVLLAIFASHAMCQHSIADVRTYNSKSDFLSDGAVATPLLESFETGGPTAWYAGATIVSAGTSADHHPTDGTKYLTWGSPTTSS